MSLKALQYAEQTLGVHSVHDELVSHLETLDGLYNDLDKAQDRRRSLVELVADAEADLLSEERGKHPDMSATGMDQHLKAAKRKNPVLRKLRDQLNEVQSEIQGLEYDVDLTKAHVRVKSARMEELGGYLNYLAAVKQAETIAKQTKPKESQ